MPLPSGDSYCIYSEADSHVSHHDYICRPAVYNRGGRIGTIQCTHIPLYCKHTQFWAGSVAMMVAKCLLRYYKS